MNVLESAFSVFLPALIPVLAAGAILLVIAFCAAPLLQRSSAATARAYWSAVIACLAALCLLEIGLPDWFFPIQRQDPSPEIGDASPGTARGLSGESLFQERAFLLDNELTQKEPLSPAPLSLSSSPEAAPESPPVVNSRFRRTFEIRDFVERAPRPAFAVWLAGAVLLGLRHLSGRILLRRIWRRGRDIDGEWNDLCREVMESISLRRTVRVRFSPGATVPMAWGIFRPKVALPESARQLKTAARRALLLHELTHVRNRDALFLFSGQIAVAIHWVNPFAWVALRRLRMAQERTCDDAVLNAGNGAAEYADLLVQIAHSGQQEFFNPAPAAMTMAQASTLKKRICAILDSKMKRTKSNRTQAGVMGVIVFGITLGLAGIGLGDKDAEKLKARLKNVSSDPIDHQRSRPDGPVQADVKEEPGKAGANVEMRGTANKSFDNVETDLNSARASTPEPAPASNPSLRPDSNSILEQKLEAIVFPSIEFAETPLPEVLEFLTTMSATLDVTETDPARKGINLILLKEARTISGMTEPQHAGLRMRVEEQTRNVHEARERYLQQVNRIADIDPDFLNSALEDAGAAMLKARSDGEAAQAELDSIKKMTLQDQGAYYRFKDEEHPIAKACETLLEAENKLNETTSVMDKNHPEVLKLQKQLETTLRTLEQLVIQNTKQLENRRMDAEKREMQLAESYEEMRHRAALVGEDSEEGLKLIELKRRYEFQLAVLERLEGNLLELEVSTFDAVPTITLQVRNMPLKDVLKYVAHLAGLTVHVEDHAVLLGTAQEAAALQSGGSGYPSGGRSP